MEIKISKKRDKHVISCKRIDGSHTWMQTDEFFVCHDLLHYAVESTLNFKNAFFGMLAGGINISDFELPKDKRPFAYTEEALIAESIVNLLALERTVGPVIDFNTSLREAHAMLRYAVSEPTVAEDKLAAIKAKYTHLLQTWTQLPVNESFTLHFDEQS